MSFTPKLLTAVITTALALYTVSERPILAQSLPAASEVIERCLEAMKPPIQFTRQEELGPTIITQAFTSDGRPALHVEYQWSLKEVDLFIGDNSYKIYPDQKVLLDTSLLRDTLYPAGYLGAHDALEVCNKSECSVALMDLKRGEKCYEINSRTPEMTFLIDRKTYQLLEVNIIDSKQAFKQTFTFADIGAAKVDSTFFAVPDGMDKHLIRDLDQYELIAEAVFKGHLKDLLQKRGAKAKEKIIASTESQLLKAEKAHEEMKKEMLEIFKNYRAKERGQEPKTKLTR